MTTNNTQMTTTQSSGWRARLEAVMNWVRTVPLALRTASAVGRVGEDARPAIVIGLGGSGHIVVTYLKALLVLAFGEGGWRGWVRLLVFDTARDSVAQTLPGGAVVQLEPGSEYFNIGDVPVGRIANNLDNLQAIRDRLGPVIGSLPATALRNGAKQLRPLGLLAMLWNFSTVFDRLQNAVWHLAGREQLDESAVMQQSGLNCFIVGSMPGGTGSGIHKDVAYLVRDLFRELGNLGDYCQIFGFGVLPQAFRGVKGPNFLANTAAFLQELDHCMLRGAFDVRYPNGRRVAVNEPPYDMFFVVDGVDAGGRTWPGLKPVCAMAARGILMLMSSSLGRKGENDFDNLDEVLSGRTADGVGTYLASLGLGFLVFPAREVVAFCSARLLRRLCREGWLRAADETQVAAEAEARLTGLAAGSIREKLSRDEEGRPMNAGYTQPQFLNRLPARSAPTEAVRYAQEHLRVRVDGEYKTRVLANVKEIAAAQLQQLRAAAERLAQDPTQGLVLAQETMQAVQAELERRLEQARKQLAEHEQAVNRLREALGRLERRLLQAGDGVLPVGRGWKVQRELGSFFRVASQLAEARFARHVQEGLIAVWAETGAEARQLARRARILRERLANVVSRLEQGQEKDVQALAAPGVSQVSLADEGYAGQLYARFAPEVQAAAERLLAGLPEMLLLAETPVEQLEKRLLAGAQALFAPILEMTVEDVIQDRAAETSAQARLAQLSQLAAPSWNLDRTRLANGGAELVRMEILGVTDDRDTIYAGESGRLVSTFDPHQLAALVIEVGAPYTALQQIHELETSLEEIRHRRPVFVMPEFLTNADQALTAFALGSIFQLVFRRGTHFFYRPADALAAEVKLGQGLENATHGFAQHDGLVQEALDRVDGVIAQQGIDRVLGVLAQYYQEAPNGGQQHALVRELKRLVRDYARELEQINSYSEGLAGN